MSFNLVASIHGAPRSGTSWLGQIFNSHSDVIYKFQPLFAYRFKDRLSYDSSQEDVVAFLEELYWVTNDDFISGNWPKINTNNEFIIKSFTKEKQPNVMIMKEVRYHHLIEKFIKSVPEMKIIGIVRNPCAVINSWIQSPREFNKEWDIAVEWRNAPSKNQGRIEEYYGYEKWRELALAFLDFEHKYPDKFFLMQYEHLVSEPVKSIKKAFSFIGLRMETQVSEFIKASQSHHIDDTYAVYKSPQVKDRWHEELDVRISEEIITELHGTRLERFLV